MNTISNRFCFSRFVAVLKCDLVEHRWRYISVFFILIAAFLLGQLARIPEYVEMSHRLSIQPDQFMPSLASDFVPFFFGVFGLALACAASDMSSVPFKSKGSSTSYLMMPATNMEKFLSRVFINVVMVIVMAFVALFLADLVRMLFVPFYEVKEFYGFTVHKVFANVFDDFLELYRMGGGQWGTTTDGTVRITGFNPFYGIITATAISLYVIFCHSLFLLGGCFWRKGAIVKTLFVIIMVFIGIVWTFVNFEAEFKDWVNTVFLPLFETDQKAGMFCLYIAIPVLLGLIILNWWLSYRFFTRKQAVAPQHFKRLHRFFGSNKK